MCLSDKISHEKRRMKKRNCTQKSDFFYHTLGAVQMLVGLVFYTCIAKYLILLDFQTKLIKTIKAIRYCNNSQENKVYIIL